MSDLWFVSFGDSRLKQAHRRIRRQAAKMGVFGERIRVFDESGLDKDFCRRMQSRLVSGSRGFGYWCWKPQVILQVMDEMKQDDVLLYADIGCHLNPRGIARLEDYVRLAKEHGIVAFQFRALGEDAVSNLKLHFLPERQWTKMDLLSFFDVADRDDVLNSGQIEATIAVVCNTPASRKVVETWRDVYYGHFELADDTPSKIPDFPDFKENRHDQSIFSILCKKNRVCLLSCGEYEHIRCYMPPDGNEKLWPETWRELDAYPVHAKRDLGKYTKLVECPDWLKPILGKRGRRAASKLYETVKPLINIVKRLRGVK